MGPVHPSLAPFARERTDKKAVVSLVLGLMSMGCFGPVFGLPAIILGAVARRDIDRSNGALTGRTVAAGGIISGLFGTGFGVVLGLWVVGVAFTPEVAPTNTEIASAPASTETAPAPAIPAPAVVTKIPPGVHAYGSLEVVDLDDTRPLHTQLVEIVQRSRGRTVILQTYARTSTACEDIAAALPDPKMQLALANVTLVRVDVEEYERELHQMHVETAVAPWFYKLDAKGSPGAAISGKAWGAPENMAPALSKFVTEVGSGSHPGKSLVTRPMTRAPRHPR